MHIKLNTLFTIQHKGENVSQVTGMFTWGSQLHTGEALVLTVYENNKTIAVFESAEIELRRWLQWRFKFIIYSINRNIQV